MKPSEPRYLAMRKEELHIKCHKFGVDSQLQFWQQQRDDGKEASRNEMREVYERYYNQCKHELREHHIIVD